MIRTTLLLVAVTAVFGSPIAEEPVPEPPGTYLCPPAAGCLSDGCLYQNEDDCSQFWQCDLQGRVFRKQCPPGTQFNSEVHVCVHSPSPTCGQQPEPEPSPTEPAATTPEPTTPEPTTTTQEPTTTEEPTTPGRPVPPEEFTCPGDGCVETGCLYQKPSNCSQFYQCDLAGNVWVKDCPAGLEFNQNARVCDWPPSPTCRRSPPPPEPTPEPTTPEPTTTTTTPEPTTTEEPTTTTEAVTTPEAPSTDFVCPPPNDLCLQTGCLYQNNQDCTKFWQCDLWGNAYAKQCPEGTQFNEKVRVCDHPPSPTCPLNQQL